VNYRKNRKFFMEN